MLIKKLGTVSLLAASIMLLDGCNILSDLFGSKKEETVVVQPEKPATPPKGQANKKNGSRKPRKDNSGRNKPKPKDNGSAVIVESENEHTPTNSDSEAALQEQQDTIDSKPTVNSRKPGQGGCIGDSSVIAEGLGELATEAGYSFQPRQPSLTMVTSISVGKGVCKGTSSYSNVVKNNLASTGRFNLVNNAIQQKIVRSVAGTSYAYLVRVAKSQNIDYLVSGTAVRSGESVNIILKITDIKNGATVWQRSVTK